MLNLKSLALTTAALLTLSLPASAQRLNSQNQGVSTWNQTQAATATVTYFDADPRGSSRQLSRQTVTLPAGNLSAERQFLNANAPQGAKYARVQVKGGGTHLIALQSGQPGNRN